MKVLLDHNVPHPARFRFRPEDDVCTTRFLGWEELSNGELLDAAEKAAFDVVVSVDKDIRDYSPGRMIFILLRPHANATEYVLALMPEVRDVLDQAQPGEHHEVGPLAGR